MRVQEWVWPRQTAACAAAAEALAEAEAAVPHEPVRRAEGGGDGRGELFIEERGHG